MKNTTFSVVIPAFNAAKTIKSTIYSVVNQTFRDLEVIVVNDGSTDNTATMVESINDDRIRVVSQENKGVSAARNKGITLARGEYVALLDADDLWFPHKLQIQADFFKDNRSMTAVQAGAVFINDAFEILSVRPCSESTDVLLETLLFKNLPNVTSTTVIKKSEFEKVGLFNEDLSFEDWEFMVRLARYSQFSSIAQPLSLYRVHDGNRSKDLSIHIESGDKILKSIFNDLDLPEHISKKRNLIYSTFYRMLCGGSFNSGNYAESIRWGLKCLVNHPSSLGYILAMPKRRLNRGRNRKENYYEIRQAVERLRRRIHSFEND